MTESQHSTVKDTTRMTAQPSSAAMVFQHVALEDITATIQARTLKDAGVKRLMTAIETHGFLAQYPIGVHELETGYRLFHGNHRVEAARRCGLTHVPALVYQDLSADDEWRLAYLGNTAHDTLVFQSFVDDAELVWTLTVSGRTQEQVAGILGWSRGKVSQYAMLKQITAEAWAIVVATENQRAVAQESGDGVAEMLRPVASPFTEYLLRAIITLTPEQQLPLVKALVKTGDKKAYRQQAEDYQAANGLEAEATQRLKHLPPAYLESALAELTKTVYLREWQTLKGPGPQLQKLLQQKLDEYDQKQTYHLHHGDLAKVAETLDAESIDVILTDPPYGQEHLPLYKTLGDVALRLLKPGGSLVVLTGQSYVPEILSLLGASLTYHWMLTYLTPGGQSVQLWQRNINTFWKPVLWFIKGDTYTGKWVGDVAKSAVNDNDKRFHTWGQSESGMADLLDRVSQPGDMVCDPFMGGGTTGVVALAHGRQFVGIDLDAAMVETTRRRCEETLAIKYQDGAK